MPRLPPIALLGAALACTDVHAALETKASGRLAFGSSYRLEAADPELLNSANAAAAGLTGHAAGAANADDANTNFRRREATSTVLKGLLELSAGSGDFLALARIKAWYDYALDRQARAWGNSNNHYKAGAPLGDRGAPALSRFSGVELADVYVQDRIELGGVGLFGRIGQQSLDWGTRSGTGGGLDVLNARDLPALRRPGAAPQETRVPAPMLFGRAELSPEFGLEGYYAAAFRPSALDLCGTFGSVNDYLVAGCDRVFVGLPAGTDRARVQSGAYMKRSAAPNRPGAGERGAALTWKSAALATDFGLYAARYTGRTVNPGLRKSSRVGAPLIAGDPDGKNMSFFTEYAEGIRLYALTFAHKRGPTVVYGELAYRPNQPLQFGVGDVVGSFLSASAPSLLRAEINALAPGAVFHGYERYQVGQAQLGIGHDWGAPGGLAYSAGAEVVAKHVASLPDPAVRRYGRADVYGLGAIDGSCPVSTPNGARQCSQDGYVSADAYAYRLRLEARQAGLAPGLNCTASALFVHDVKGWSGDGLVNQGRKSATLALRFEYRQRYLAEAVYMPVWGGEYNVLADRDQLALAVGIRF